MTGLTVKTYTYEKMYNLKYITLTIISISFIVFGFITDSPADILHGLYKIIIESGILITDYIAVAGIGASFVNSGLLMLISVFILFLLKKDIDGISVASVFLMGSFALFGKNIFNVWIIIFGVVLYAKFRKAQFKDYVHTAFLATSISPIITEILFVFDMHLWLKVVSAVLIGVSIGFFIPPLSLHLFNIHKGYNLYNIGFTVGILGTIYVSVLKSHGYSAYSKMIWSMGNNVILGVFLTVLFILLIAAGVIINPGAVKKMLRVFRYSGRLASDFIALEGFETALINMGLNGLFAMVYVCAVGGSLNGPTIGGVLTMVGFGAFGKHIKNMTPIFIGVLIGSLTKTWYINDPPILLAALFGTALAPISGHYGWVWGIVAGFINSSVVLNSGILHGGMNLYNTGFSAGISAAIIVPLLDTFLKKKQDV